MIVHTRAQKDIEGRTRNAIEGCGERPFESLPIFMVSVWI